MERCFREAKDELGLDHYEVRGWRCVHRHFYITQASHLCWARMRQQYDDRPEFPNKQGPHLGRLTVEQVRSALDTWLEAADMTPAARKERHHHEFDKMRYYQRRNEHARESHTTTRITRLRALGIDADHIKSCIPDDP